jgi:archaellum biogenesis ATPase FlaH
MPIKNDLMSNPVLFVSLSPMKYNDYIVEIIKDLSGESICYVTLNKTCGSLLDIIKDKGLSPTKIFFIDGIANIAVAGKPSFKNCVTLRAPNALKDIELNITKDKSDIIIFDSLSTLLIYENLATIVSFVKSLIKNVRPRKIVFIALDGEKETKLLDSIKKNIDHSVVLK